MPPRDIAATPTLDPIEDITRRRLLTAIPGMVILAGGISCGTDDAPEATPTQTPASGFPVTIEHQFGSTTIPAQPTRIVCYGMHEQEWLLALGVNPIAMREWWGGHPFDTTPWSQQALLAADPIVLPWEGDIERVATLDPDLILVTYSDVDADQYAKLSQLAPTIPRPDGYIDFGMPWDEELRLIGTAAGKPDTAEQVIDEIDSKFAAYRAKYPEWEGKTAAMVTLREGGTVRVRAPGDSMNGTLQSLGFVIPEEFARLAEGSFIVDLSGEQARLLDVDLIIDYGDQPIADDPVFQLLDVVTEGRVIRPGKLVDGMQFNSPLSIPYVLDQVVPLIEEAIAKLA